MTNSNGRAVDRRKLLVASESFSLERGGAARVGRLLARLAADIGLDADLLALSDPEPIGDFNLSSRTAAGGRADFAFRCWTSGVTRSHFIYNHVGMARAHCLLPMCAAPMRCGCSKSTSGAPECAATTGGGWRKPAFCCRSATSPAGARPSSCHPREEPRFVGWPPKRTTF